jgi:ribosome-associated toxin RatA of RatAB toxin-antitoxin module
MAKQSTLVIPADPALVYEILTDYDHMAEWMPQVSSARLLARDGDLTLAEITPASTEAPRFAMECIHRLGQQVTWRPIETKIPVTEYQWTLEPVANDSCKVSLALQCTGSADAENYIQALRNQASLFLPIDSAAGPGCEKILEIVETASGLMCWLQGKKYRLVPEPEA